MMIHRYACNEIEDEKIEYAVMICQYDGSMVFVRHKERETLEFPGGHRETGETIMACAKRELWEETGAVQFEINTECVYGVKQENGEESFGMLFTGEITVFEKISESSEIRERLLLKELPTAWTYPEIQPALYEYVKSSERIEWICSAEEKEAVANMILYQLPEWFGLPKSTEEYIQQAKNLPFVVYKKGKQTTGFLAIKETGAYTAEIYVMGVLKDVHHQGVGTALVKECISYAREHGYEYLQVKTVQEGHDCNYDQTNHFYKYMGFRELECFPTLWDPLNPCQIYIMYILKKSNDPDE